MKEKILKIADDLRNGLITTNESQTLLSNLFKNNVKLCCSCKQPLPEGFITRCPDCYDRMWFPK